LPWKRPGHRDLTIVAPVLLKLQWLERKFGKESPALSTGCLVANEKSFVCACWLNLVSRKSR
jgi:hypothetical protein